MKRFNFIGRIYKDIVNYVNFRETIKREKANPNSVFSQYKFTHNKFYTKLGCVLTLPDEYSNVDILERDVIIFEKLYPITQYFDITLLFGECLYIEKPDVWMEVKDDGTMVETLSYKVELSYQFDILNKRNLLIVASFFALWYSLYKIYMYILKLIPNV